MEAVWAVAPCKGEECSLSVPFEVLGAVMERKRHNYIMPSITEPDILQVVGSAHV